MIKVWSRGREAYTVTPTIFPDKTSQVWGLPEHLLHGNITVQLQWSFEEEREILDLIALRKLLPAARFELWIPYLPYARQDKAVGNYSTFSLAILADLLNHHVRAEDVMARDAHNPAACERLIVNFRNQRVDEFHRSVCKRFRPDVLVFPDLGAAKRYAEMETVFSGPNIICDKNRDPGTGEILGMVISHGKHQLGDQLSGSRFLVVDDICDGGATFLHVAKLLKSVDKMAELGLAVTHGIFSRGRELLIDAGYQIFTTNSLLQNADGYEV